MHALEPTVIYGARRTNGTMAKPRIGSLRADGITLQTLTTLSRRQTPHERKSRRRTDGPGRKTLTSGRRKHPNGANGRSRRRSRPLASRTRIRKQAGRRLSSPKTQRVDCMETRSILTNPNRRPRRGKGTRMCSVTNSEQISRSLRLPFICTSHPRFPLRLALYHPCARLFIPDFTIRPDIMYPCSKARACLQSDCERRTVVYFIADGLRIPSHTPIANSSELGDPMLCQTETSGWRKFPAQIFSRTCLSQSSGP